MNTPRQLNAWASTLPWTDGDPRHTPLAGSPCTVPACGQPLNAGEVVYAVIEHGGPDAPEPIPCPEGLRLSTADCGHAHQWVCWRHVRGAQRPITVEPDTVGPCSQTISLGSVTSAGTNAPTTASASPSTNAPNSATWPS